MRRIATLLLVGCGTSTTPVEAGAPEAGSDADASPDAMKFAGSVVVTSTMAMTTGYDMSATFGAELPTDSCVPTFMEGSCTFRDCPMPADAGSPSLVGAGNVDVDMIALMRSANGDYHAQGSMPLFSGGESVTARGTGDPNGAPAFMLQTTAPARITVTMPIFPTVVAIPIPVSQPLELQWTGGTSGGVHILLVTRPMTRIHTIECQVTASAGQTIIGMALLQKMAKGPGTLGITVTSANAMTQGDWRITLSAFDTAVDPNGKPLTLVDADVL
jgi:hypothetical protein